jgi:hypothetical protein
LRRSGVVLLTISGPSRVDVVVLEDVEVSLSATQRVVLLTMAGPSRLDVVVLEDVEVSLYFATQRY